MSKREERLKRLLKSDEHIDDNKFVSQTGNKKHDKRSEVKVTDPFVLPYTKEDLLFGRSPELGVRAIVNAKHFKFLPNRADRIKHIGPHWDISETRDSNEYHLKKAGYPTPTKLETHVGRLAETLDGKCIGPISKNKVRLTKSREYVAEIEHRRKVFGAQKQLVAAGIVPSTYDGNGNKITWGSQS